MAGPLLTAERSADAAATLVAVVVDVLFAGTRSTLTALMVAVFDTVAGTPLSARRTSVSVTGVPGGNAETIVHVTTPVAPAAGVMQLKTAGPRAEIDWKVIPVGITSATATLVALLGPLFRIVIGYVALLPAVTVAGPFLVTCTSAEGVPKTVGREALLSPGAISDEPLSTEATFVRMLPAVVAGLDCITIVNVAVPAFSNTGAMQLIVPVPPTAGVVHV